MPDIVKSGALGTIERDQIEDFCRREARTVVISEKKALTRVLGKYLLYVDPSEEAVAPQLMLNGYWETWLTQAIARHVKPGMRCLEISAGYYGYYTHLLCDLVGPKGSVHAIGVSEACVTSLHLNGFYDRVQTVRGGRDMPTGSDALPTERVDFCKILHALSGAALLRDRLVGTMMATGDAELTGVLEVVAAESGYRVRRVDFTGKPSEKPASDAVSQTLWIDRA